MALNTYVEQAEARRRAAARVITNAPETPSPDVDPGPAPFTTGQHVRYDFHPHDVYTVTACHLTGSTWEVEVTAAYGGWWKWPVQYLTLLP